MTTFQPGEATLRTAAKTYRYALFSASVIADGDTPLSLFARLEGDPGGAFLLESVEGGERTGRWSFFGSGLEAGLRFVNGQGLLYGPSDATPLSSSPLDAIRTVLGDRAAFIAPGLPPFSGGLVGFFGFETLSAFESVPQASAVEDEDPVDLDLMFVDDLFAYDHATHRLHAMTRVDLSEPLEDVIPGAQLKLQTALARLTRPIEWAPFPDGPVSLQELPLRSTRSRSDYEQAVLRAKQAIIDGEVFQAVVSLRFEVPVAVQPFDLYRALRALNPSPYMFLLRRPIGPTLVGASPEVLVRVEGRDVFVRPIAGTRRRGSTIAEDMSLERELLADEKERAEHMMLLDLGRNDVGRVADSGTVRVEAPFHIERYAHVMHMVSDVHGELAEGKDACDALKAGFPAGTVVGAPKIRAAELLTELETHRRGPYAGAVGYFDLAGGMDTCIAIRTAVVYPDRVWVQAGAGVVYDSDPAREFEECENKARSPLTAVALALKSRQQQETPS